MIYSILHSGSGLGNQLHRYIAVRCLALDKGYAFSVIAPNNFKGSSFMNLDMGVTKDWDYITDLSGKVIVDTHFEETKSWEEKTNYYNPEFNFIEDNTIIDGEFQDERYFEHYLKEIDTWLKVEPIEIHDDICVIGFRGGEYAIFPELFLTIDYWNEAINIIKSKNPNVKFEVHTDDFALAQVFFPKYKIISNIDINWRSMRYAKYAIIANSSFYILPRLLNGGLTIAPKYWARRNTKEWSMPQNYYKCFKYI